MGARKMEKSWYVDFRFNGRRYRKKSPENSKKGAQAYEKKLIQRLMSNDGRPFRKDPLAKEPLYKDYVEQWYQTYVLANNRPAEHKKKRTIIKKHLVPAFGRLRLSSIHAMDIESFKRDKLRSGLNPKTINNILSSLRKSLDCAVEWDELQRVPKIKWMKTTQKEIRVVSDKTLRILREDRSVPLWNLAIIVAMHTGMRIGEVLALRWKDLEFQEGQLGVVHVNGSINIEHERALTKNGKTRVIPMSYELRSRLLEEYELVRSSQEAYVFDRGDGIAHSTHAAQGALRRITKRELRLEEHVTWHMFRHTFASTLAKKGTNIRVVQELLGHASITMTERYSHIDLPSMQSAVQLLDYVLGNSGQYVGSGVFGLQLEDNNDSNNLATLKQKKTINDDL